MSADPNAAALLEIVSLLRTGPPAVRVGAARALAGLSGTPDGRALLASVAPLSALASALSDADASVCDFSVKALINLSADVLTREAVASRVSLASSLLERTRDAKFASRRGCVALLANISTSDAGAEAILEPESAVVGLGLRRLVPLLVAPEPEPTSAAAGGAGAEAESAAVADDFELLAVVLGNVSRIPVARDMLLEPERAMLAALLPQLSARSPVRRRGVAALIRNCALFATSGEPGAAAALNHMLSPGLGLVTALLLPLAGPSRRYTADEREGMTEVLARTGDEKCREPDSSVRLAICETLLSLARARVGRDALRDAKAYYVVRALHWMIEGVNEDEKEPGENGGGVSGVMVRAETPAETLEAELDGKAKLSADDEATVEAINALVQQLWRDDEVPMGKGGGNGGMGGGGRSGTATEDAERRREDAELRASREAARKVPTGPRVRPPIQMRSEEEARAMAKRISSGELHSGRGDEDL